MSFVNIKTVSVPSIGKLALAEKPGTFTPSSTKNEHQAGREAADGGYTQTAVPAKLELNLNMIAGMDIDKINAISSEDVTVRLSDGSVYMMPKAFRSGDPVGITDGPSKLTLMSNSSEKV